MHPRVERAFASLGIEPERADVSGHVGAYADLFCSLWRDGDGFLLVEHDVEPTAAALRQAESCPCGWGVSPYPGPGADYASAPLLTRSLGFVRFSDELVRALPRLPEAVDAVENAIPGHAARDWRRLDVRVSAALLSRNVAPCLHVPVPHHHRYAYGCACGEEHE